VLFKEHSRFDRNSDPSMQREGAEGSDRQDKLAHHPIDQAAFNYTPSQAATSYAGSMSGPAGRRANREDDDNTNASFYTSYTQATDDRLIRKEGSRVSRIAVE
jgi:hypothetical protein